MHRLRQAHHHPELTGQTIWDVFEAERPKLVPYAGRFNGFHAVPASVSKTCLVRFDNNKYSVAASAVGRPIEVHTYADRIVIRQDGRIVGEHARSFGRGETIYDPWHYVPVLPGIQAIATTAPDLPPVPGIHATFAREHEYKRHGTLSLLVGIDLLTGKVHALVRDHHRSREFIEFLKLLDTAYPARTAVKLILDNHSAHISRETTAWLDSRPRGRFAFTFTPKHGSWLNLIEGFFSKFARSVLKHIRVASKQELRQRIMAGIHEVNQHPVIHSWSYKLADAA